MNENTTPPSQRGAVTSRLRNIGQWFARPKGDVITAEVGEGSRSVVVGKNIIQIGSIRIPYWLLALSTIAIVLVIVAIIDTWPKVEVIEDNSAQMAQGVEALLAASNATPTSTATPLPTPTTTPVVMPSDTYNIAVAPFQAFDSAGQPVELSESVDRAKSIARFLATEPDFVTHWRQLTGEDITVWGPSENIPEVNEESVITVAKSLKASVVIYGVFKQHSVSEWTLQPSFFVNIAERQAMTLDEFVGPYSLGAAITYNRTGPSGVRDLTEILEARIRTLALIFMGLDYHERHEATGYCQAAHLFAMILAEPQFHPSHFEVCQTTQFVPLPALDTDGFDRASKTLAALFLGNSYLQLAYQLNEGEQLYQPVLEQAKAVYQRGLEFDPDHPRLLNNLGNVLYHEVTMKYKEYNRDCSAVEWEQLEEAKSYHEQAISRVRSNDSTLPMSEVFSQYIEASANLSLGRIYNYIYRCNLSDKELYETAKTYYVRVSELYEQQPSNLFIVLAVYAWLEMGEITVKYAIFGSEEYTDTEFRRYFQTALTLSRASGLLWLIEYIENESETCIYADEC